MPAAVKLQIVVPEDHRVEILLPEEIPSGPAELIVLAEAPPRAVRETEPADAEEHLVRRHGLLVYTGELAGDPGLELEAIREARVRRLSGLG